MTLDHRLLSLLVCPLCKGPLQMRRSAENRQDVRPKADDTSRPPPEGDERSGKATYAQELLCPADRLAFPVRDGMPVMLEGEARNVGDDEIGAPAATPAPAPR